MKACRAPHSKACLARERLTAGKAVHRPLTCVPSRRRRESPAAAHASFMSLTSVLALSAALHLYLGFRLVPALPGAGGWLLAAWLLASAMLVPAGLLARRFLRPPAADRLTWVGMVAMGLFSSLFVLTVLRDVLLLVLAF